MASERTRLGLWLFMWAYMLVTLVVPLALGAGGVWTWDIATAVASGFWLILFIVQALVQAARPECRKRRSPHRQKANGDDGS